MNGTHVKVALELETASGVFLTGLSDKPCDVHELDLILLSGCA